MKKIILMIFILSLFVASAVWAHQPQLVTSTGTIQISTPNISQAFYAELKGAPALYEFSVPFIQDIYVGLLTPYAENIDKDYQAEIFLRGESGFMPVGVLEGANFNWTKFFEEFGGDDYWNGPELKQEYQAGDYLIRISSPDNLGQYVLVIGEKESFPITQIPHTLQTLLKLKTDYFGKSPWSFFDGKIGQFTGGGVVLAIILIVVIIWLIIRKKR